MKVTRYRLPTHQIRGLSVTIFSQNIGSLCGKLEKMRVIGCSKVAHNWDNFFLQILAVTCDFFFPNLILSKIFAKTVKIRNHWM